MINKLLSNLPASFSKEPGILLDFLAPIADELANAKAGVVAALDQMLLSSADGEWLDEWGGHFGIPRLTLESDEIYGARIIAELIQPKCNNVAMSNAIGLYVGGLAATVTDAPMESTSVHLRRDGSTTYNGTKDRQPIVCNFFGQFDVNTQYDLTSNESLNDLSSRIKAVVERLKSAGTKLRAVVFSGYLTDAASPATDALQYQVQYASADDVYFGARSIRDGSVSRSARIADLYDGVLARNGATSRHGWHVAQGSATYQSSVDPMLLEMDATWRDEFVQVTTFGSGYKRDGSVNRKGVTGDADDAAGISITKVLARDGRYRRGSIRNGSLFYKGIQRTHGTVFYGGQTKWSEFLL